MFPWVVSQGPQVADVPPQVCAATHCVVSPMFVVLAPKARQDALVTVTLVMQG